MVDKGKKIVEETLKIDKSELSREAPKTSEAPKVSAYKPKVSFPTRLK